MLDGGGKRVLYIYTTPPNNMNGDLKISNHLATRRKLLSSVSELNTKWCVRGWMLVFEAYSHV